MSKVGKSYVQTRALRLGASSEVDANTLITVSDLSTEDYNLPASEFINGTDALRIITAGYTATSSDSIVVANGTFTVTLPTAVGVAGKIYNIKNIGNGSITVSGSETIDSASSVILLNFEGITVASTGTDWIIL